MNRQILVLACALSATMAVAQTQPIKPQTPDIIVPPAVVLPLPPGIAGAQPLSMKEAVALTLNKLATVQAARAAIDAAAGRTQQTGAALNPQFGITGSVSRTEQFRGANVGGGSGSVGGGGGSSSPNSFNIALTAAQLLFDFGKTRNAVRQQEALQRATEFDLSTVEQDAVLSTKTAFITFLQNQQLLSSSEDNLANRQRQLAEADARLSSGLGQPADYVRAKTGLADAVLALEDARNAANASRISLAKSLGIDPRTPLTPDSTSIPKAEELNVSDVNAALDKALNDRSEIKEARQRVLAAGLGVAVARLSNAPSVNLTGSLNSRGSNDPTTNQSGVLGISISWQFGDGGLAAGRTKEAIANEEIAKANLQTVSQQVVQDVTQAYSDLQTAKQKVVTATEQLANATELLRISEGRYSGGLGTFLEVTDAQQSLYAAQKNRFQALAAVDLANARLLRAEGVPPAP
jgi:outer membrane protein TolC